MCRLNMRKLLNKIEPPRMRASLAVKADTSHRVRRVKSCLSSPHGASHEPFGGAGAECQPPLVEFHHLLLPTLELRKYTPVSFRMQVFRVPVDIRGGCPACRMTWAMPKRMAHTLLPQPECLIVNTIDNHECHQWIYEN
jgi:hypothetical protein